MPDPVYDSLPTSGPEPTRQQYQEQQAGGPTTQEQQRRFLLGLTDQDRDVGEAVTRVMARVPWIRKAPGMVMDVATDAVRRGNVNNLLLDMQDADTFLRLRQHYQELSATSPQVQDAAWGRMPMGMQHALRDQGYRPPSEIEQAKRASAGVADGGLLHDLGHAIGSVGHVLNTGGGLPGPSISDIGGMVWDGLDETAKLPAHVYRWARVDDNNLLGDFKDPGHLLAAWRESADGEHLFDPHVAAKVQDMFDDPKAYQFVKRLAAGESAYDIAASLADPTAPNYPTAVGQVMDFASNATVQQGVKMLGGSKISPGRDLSRKLGVDPQSNLGVVLSGAGDAAFQWYANPFLIAGAAKTALLETRLGIGLVDGENVVERIKGFYGTNLNELAAGRLTDVSDPSYWSSLRGVGGINQQQRAAVAIADHVTQGKWAELAQAMPGTERLIPDLRANAGWIKTPADVGNYFADGSGLTALAKGELANYRYQFKTLPQLTRLGTVKVAAKVAFEDAIDFAADASVRLREPLLASDVAAGNIDSVQRTVGNGASLILQPIARAYQKLSDLIPTQDFITLTGPDAERAQQFDRFLSFGVHGSERKALYNDLISAGTEATARNVARSAMESIFANLGLRDSPDTRGFVSKWLGQFDQRYALDDLDLNPLTGRSGIFPDVDRANAIAIPKFSDLMAEVRRTRLERLLTGWGGEEFAQRAMARFEPVVAGIDTANRMWRTAALLSYSFAVRVGGEEAVNQYARLGPGHNLESWIARPMSAADPGEALLSQLVSPDDPMLVRRALRKVGNPVFSILPDEVRFSARSAAEKVAASVEGWFGKQTDTVLGVTDLEKRALRQPSFVDRVAKAFDEVGAGKSSMMYGLDAPPRERQTFATITQNTVKGPVSVDFAKIGGKYDEYAVGDPVFRQVQADRLQHLAADRVARSRLAVRSLFLDGEQADRIASVVAPGVSDSYSVIEDARRSIGELPQPVRARLENWVHDPASHDLDAVVAEARAHGLAHPEVANLPSIIERMPLLNTSERMALLADPSRALPELAGGTEPEHWVDLLDRVQRGDKSAWHQLENEVGVARMKEADMSAHVDAMDRVGASFGVSEGGLSRDDALTNWSDIQRQALDQATLRDGRVVHGLTVPMSQDRLDSLKHVIDADFELPTATIGPGLEAIKRGRSFTERVVNGAWEDFDRIIGGVSRTPLAQRAYVDGYVQADRLLGAQLRSPELEAAAKQAIRGDLGKAGDVLQEIDHRMEEAYRAGSGEIRNATQLDNDLLRHAMESHGVKLPEGADMNAVRHWWASESGARDQIARVAADRMLTEVTPYIHDPSVRSQFAESHRWAFPFLFAQEQFYKRWGRTFVQSPEALMRLNLLNHAMNASGWLEPDPNTGQPLFVYPGSSWVNKALGGVVEALTLGKMSVTLPIAAPLTGQLQTALPGLEHLDHLPAPGPAVALPLHLLARLSPEVGQTLEHDILGDQGEGRDLVSTLVPSRLKRFYDAITATPEDMAGSTIAAMQVMEANDLAHFRKTGKHLSLVPQDAADTTGTSEGSRSGEVQQYIDRLNNHSRVLRITQALFGLAGPASPHADLTPGDLDAQFAKLLQSGMPIEEAMGRYLAENPDATPFTVFATHAPSHAPTDPSAAAYDTMAKHEAFFQKYDRAAAWFLPEAPVGAADGAFDLRAWREMLANQVRTRKGLTEMWRDIKYAEAAPEFFRNSQKVTEALARAGAPEQRAAIRNYWQEWSSQYQAVHPVFAEMYNSNTGSQERTAILKQTTQALSDSTAPKLTQNAALRQVVENYAKTNAALDALKTNRTEAGTARKKAIRLYFAQWATAFTEAHPTAQAFYQRIIFPDLGIPAVTDSGA